MKLVALVLVASVSGCAGYSFSANHSTYAPGSRVTITLRNLSIRELSYNLCGVELDHRSGDRWLQVDYRVHLIDENGRDQEFKSGEYTCNAVLRALGPGSWSTARIWLDPTAPDGEYRFRTGIELGRKSVWLFTYGRSRGFGGSVVTPTFHVRRKS
jgi:hypothetical protein